jgi:uncharacterized protein YjbI with pentapeptide repeats
MITQLEQDKVKDLVDKGVLTAEQADELMETLAGNDTHEENPGEAEHPDDSGHIGAMHGESKAKDGPGNQKRQKSADWPDIDALAKGAVDTVSSAMKFTFSGINSALGQLQGSSQSGNKIVMSKAEHPSGSRYVFSDNEIRMGKLTDITLNDSEMKGNKIMGSSVSGLKVAFGAFNRNSVSAASVVDVAVENGMIADCAFNGSKVHDILVKEDSMITGAVMDASKISDLRVSGESKTNDCSVKCSKCDSLEITRRSSVSGLAVGGSKVKDIKLIETGLTGMSVQASTMSRMTFVKTTMTDIAVGASKVSMVRCEDSTLKDVIVSGMAVLDLDIKNCRLSGVSFKKTPVGFNLRHIAKLRLINATMKDCEFVNCTFFNTVIRDVDLSGVRLSDAMIKGQTITCKEDLLKYLK